MLFSNVRVQDFCNIEDCVILPNVEIGNNVTLRRAIVDKHCRLPDGLAAGVDPEADRKRFLCHRAGGDRDRAGKPGPAGPPPALACAKAGSEGRACARFRRAFFHISTAGVACS
jgi:NDP-sugar pyrophosphorylase family protein